MHLRLNFTPTDQTVFDISGEGNIVTTGGATLQGGNGLHVSKHVSTSSKYFWLYDNDNDMSDDSDNNFYNDDDNKNNNNNNNDDDNKNNNYNNKNNIFKQKNL